MKKESGEIQRKSPTRLPKIVSADEIFDRMQQVLDRVSTRAYEIFESRGGGMGWDLADWFNAESELLHPVHLQVVQTDGGLQVQAEVPGFTAEEIEVAVEPRRLTITGKRESKSEEKKGETVYTDRCSNRFLRVVDLPAEVDAKKVKATLKNGILEMEMPKAAPPEKIRIEAKAS